MTTTHDTVTACATWIDPTSMHTSRRSESVKSAPAQTSALAPLRIAVYRNLFVAQLVSNIGTWMQTVGAQWFLVEQHSTATVIALVQTASLTPTLVLGLFGGVFADLFEDRKSVV